MPNAQLLEAQLAAAEVQKVAVAHVLALCTAKEWEGLGAQRCSSGSTPYKKCTWHKMRKQLQVKHCPATHAGKTSSPFAAPCPVKHGDAR